MRKTIAFAALCALPVPVVAQTATVETAPRLEFGLRISSTRALLPGAKSNDDGNKNRESTSRWRISLSPDSVAMLDLDTSVETVVDRKKELLVFLDHGKKRFRTQALLGWIAAADQEHTHRKRLAKVLNESGVEDAANALATFWLETLFCHGEAAAGEVKFADRDGGLVCTRGKETVLETTPGGPELPARLRKAYGLFLIRMCRIHPAIRARLVGADSLPQRIRLRSYDAGTRTDMELQVLSWPPSNEKVPVTPAPKKAMSTYAAWIDPTDPLDVLFGDIASKRIGTKPTTKEEYVARVKARANAGRHLDAFLVLLESTFTYPDVPIRELVSGIDMKSEDAAPLGQFMRPRKTQKEHVAAIEAMRAIPRDGLQGVVTIDILQATGLASLKRYAESEKLFLELLRGKPWLAGPFRDLGQTYTERFAMPKAWRCWERAYELSPKHPLIRDFPARQAKLRERYADWL